MSLLAAFVLVLFALLAAVLLTTFGLVVRQERRELEAAGSKPTPPPALA
jgi:hypothetical protein